MLRGAWWKRTPFWVAKLLQTLGAVVFYLLTRIIWQHLLNAAKPRQCTQGMFARAAQYRPVPGGKHGKLRSDTTLNIYCICSHPMTGLRFERGKATKFKGLKLVFYHTCKVLGVRY